MPPKLNHVRCHASAFIAAGLRQSARTTSTCGPGGQARARLEGQVGAGVVRDLPPVDPHGRAVVDRVEAHRVVAVAGDVDVVRYQATEPSNERVPAAPRTWRALGEKGTVTVRPLKSPLRPAERHAAPGAVAADDPRAVERALARPPRSPAAAAPRSRRCSPMAPATTARTPSATARQAASMAQRARAHQPPRVAATRAVSARPCRVRVDRLLTTLLTAALARRLRWRGNGR